MEITEEQQKLLAREIKLLIDENLDSTEVLEHARSLALIVFDILSNHGDPGSLGFSLQEYAFECLEVSRGNAEATAWIDKNNKEINKALGL